jgi:hypothetical protein
MSELSKLHSAGFRTVQCQKSFRPPRDSPRNTRNLKITGKLLDNFFPFAIIDPKYVDGLEIKRLAKSDTFGKQHECRMGRYLRATGLKNLTSSTIREYGCGIRCVEEKVKAGVWRVRKQIRFKTGLNKQLSVRSCTKMLRFNVLL